MPADRVSSGAFEGASPSASVMDAAARSAEGPCASQPWIRGVSASRSAIVQVERILQNLTPKWRPGSKRK